MPLNTSAVITPREGKAAVWGASLSACFYPSHLVESVSPVRHLMMADQK